MSKIPGPTIPSSSPIRADALRFSSRDNLVFSFQLLENNEYFGLCENGHRWSAKLFEMLKSASSASVEDLLSGKLGTLRFHSHANAKPPCDWPKNVSPRDCYQLRISTANGGIHGVLSSTVFYVFWLDPLHNLYPDSKHGGLRKVKLPFDCCRELTEQVESLTEENNKLKQENGDLWKELADKEV